MFDETDIIQPSGTEITLGGDLSTFSVGDIDERIALLENEITRLKQEREQKSSSLSAAEEFFKK